MKFLVDRFNFTDGPESAFTIYFSGCNMKCPYCYNYSLMEYYKLDQEQVLSEIENIRQIGPKGNYFNTVKYLILSGGECTIDLDSMMVFIKKGRELGLKIGLYTNGTNILLDTIVEDKKLIDYFDFISIDYKALLLTQDFYTPKQAKKLMYNFGILSDSNKRINIRTTLVKQFHNEDVICKMGMYLSSLFDNKDNVKWYLQEFKETSNILDPSYTSLSSFISKEPFIKLISEKFPSLNIDN